MVESASPAQRKNMDEAIDVKEAVVAPQAETHEAQPQAPVEDKQDRNWREMRRAYDELKSLSKNQSEMIESLKTQLTPKEKDELDEIADDDYIPAGQVKKLVEKRAQKYAQEEARRVAEGLLAQRDQKNFLDRLKGQYSDFNDVVNAETLEILETKDPELAQSIADLKDPYKIGLQSYKYIKAMRLSDEAPSLRRAKEVEEKLEKNAKTIQTPQAFEKRPMAAAFQLTNDMKNALYKEMMQYATGV